MSHEVAEADQNLREIARLRADLAQARRWAAAWKRAAKDERGNALSLAQLQAQTHKYFLASCADSEAQRSRNTEMADALRAYLKAQRRMLEKWADGSDELKTALWRDLHACENTAVAALDRSADAEVARILSMSDEEILAEVRAEGGNPEKIALEGRLTFERAELAATRADLDTLRNGVAWLGAERDRARRWGALWKRAAKDGARDWRDLAAAYEDMRAENTTVRRVARLLVGAWRKERAAAEDARKDARYFLSELEAFIPDAAARLAEIKRRWPRQVEPLQNDPATE